jgi:hypothetical protein
MASHMTSLCVPKLALSIRGSFERTSHLALRYSP